MKLPLSHFPPLKWTIKQVSPPPPQAGSDREVVSSFINLQVLQESQFDYCRVPSTLRVLLLVSLVVCPPEAPCWGDWSRCQSWMGEEGLGVGGMCSWSIQRMHAQSLRWGGHLLMKSPGQNGNAGKVIFWVFQLSLWSHLFASSP